MDTDHTSCSQITSWAMPTLSARLAAAEQEAAMVFDHYSDADPSAPPKRQDDNGMMSLFFGGAAAFFAFLPFIGVIAWPLSITGLVFGKFSLDKARRGETGSRHAALGGIALSVFALMLCLGWLAFTIVALAGT